MIKEGDKQPHLTGFDQKAGKRYFMLWFVSKVGFPRRVLDLAVTDSMHDAIGY